MQKVNFTFHWNLIQSYCSTRQFIHHDMRGAIGRVVGWTKFLISDFPEGPKASPQQVDILKLDTMSESALNLLDEFNRKQGATFLRIVWALLDPSSSSQTPPEAFIEDSVIVFFNFNLNPEAIPYFPSLLLIQKDLIHPLDFLIERLRNRGIQIIEVEHSCSSEELFKKYYQEIFINESKNLY